MTVFLSALGTRHLPLPSSRSVQSGQTEQSKKQGEGRVRQKSHLQAYGHQASNRMFRQGGKVSSSVSEGRRKVHTTWEDESELIEEYDLKTDELIGVMAGY